MARNRHKPDFLEMRHLRYFLAVAEELHFARAAERLQIEQSPLSRAIRDMEGYLGVRLFERTTRSTRITRAGEVLVVHARRAVAVMEQAKAGVLSAALGRNGQLRLGLSDGIVYPRLAELLVGYRREEPDVEVLISEIPLTRQIQALREDLLDVSISLNEEARDGILAEVIWRDPIAAVLPANHPLAQLKEVCLLELLKHPLILLDPDAGSSCRSQIDRLIYKFPEKALVAERVASFSVMLTLVGAGRGISLVGVSQMATVQRSDIVVRTLTGEAPVLTTYILRADGDLSQPLTRFIKRARSMLFDIDSAVVLSESLDHAK